MDDSSSRSGRFATGLLFAGSLVVAGLLGEALLALAGVEPARRLRVEVPPEVPWWRCDEGRGCRYVRQHVEDPPRYNAAGFRDADPFRSPTDGDERYRILLLGDSFAYGASAYGPGESFAEIVENELPALLWNAGIPGNGQREELAALRRLQPLLDPDLVLLAFYVNDFEDNLYPPGKHYVFSDGHWILRYRRLASGEMRRLSPEEAYRRAFPQAGTPSEMVATSRVGTLVLRAISRFRSSLRSQESGGATSASTGSSAPEIPGRAVTGELLERIREETITGGSELLVLVIPSRADVAEPGPRYSAALELCGELALRCLTVRDLLRLEDYDRDHPLDSHWNATGHAKVGNALTEAIRELRSGCRTTGEET